MNTNTHEQNTVTYENKSNWHRNTIKLLNPKFEPNGFILNIHKDIHIEKDETWEMKESTHHNILNITTEPTTFTNHHPQFFTNCHWSNFTFDYTWLSVFLLVLRTSQNNESGGGEAPKNAIIINEPPTHLSATNNPDPIRAGLML